MTLPAWLLLGGVALVVPMALILVTLHSAPNERRLLTAARLLQPIAAALVAVAFVIHPGGPAAILCLPWLAVGALTAIVGCLRLGRLGAVYVDETAISVGLLYLPIGGLWLMATRLGFHPLGFGSEISLLTAVHFHYAGLAAATFTGMLGRAIAVAPGRWWRPYRLAAIGVVIGPVLVAAGITTTSVVQIIGTAVLAVSLAAVALVTLTCVVPRAPWAARLLLISAALASPVAMMLAIVFVVGVAVGHAVVDIPAMGRSHGLLNAGAFSLLGLAGWLLVRPAPRYPSAPPFSRFAAGWHVGPDFFARRSSVSPSPTSARGLVDNFRDYGRADFDASAVDPEVVRFYEQTDDYALLVEPLYHPGFALAARVYAAISARVEQMNLPPAALRRGLIRSSIVRLDDQVDGRPGVRAWIRTYATTGRAVYVAAYANHEREGESYMNIAFPLPGGNLTSILHLARMPEQDHPGGILLTTLANAARQGDQGVYFRWPLLSVRLPLDETIEVWPSPGGLSARHAVWFLGIPAVTLEYSIRRGGEPQ